MYKQSIIMAPLARRLAFPLVCCSIAVARGSLFASLTRRRARITPPPQPQSMAVVVGIFYAMYQNRTVYGAAELRQHREQQQQSTARFHAEMAKRQTPPGASPPAAA